MGNTVNMTIVLTSSQWFHDIGSKTGLSPHKRVNLGQSLVACLYSVVRLRCECTAF